MQTRVAYCFMEHTLRALSLPTVRPEEIYLKLFFSFLHLTSIQYIDVVLYNVHACYPPK